MFNPKVTHTRNSKTMHAFVKPTTQENLSQKRMCQNPQEENCQGYLCPARKLSAQSQCRKSCMETRQVIPWVISCTATRRSFSILLAKMKEQTFMGLTRGVHQYGQLLSMLFQPENWVQSCGWSRLKTDLSVVFWDAVEASTLFQLEDTTS